MATRDVKQYHLRPFWGDDFKSLDYTSEPFNDPESQATWLAMGFADKFVGDMCDMRRTQTSWNSRMIDIYSMAGWQDVGTSYYRMNPGSILPRHSDTYRRYIELHGLQGREQNIWRAIVFLEDWKSGHYLEVGERAITHWNAGDVVEWRYDVPHMAANMGFTPRYTLQLTGHKNGSQQK